MADQVVMGPQREAGLSYVDSLYWGKGDNVFFAEDSNAPGGYNIAGIYNLATRKTVTIAGAIGISSLYKKFLSTQDNCYKKKMPHCAEVPVESCYDVQKCETVSVPKCQKEAIQKCWEVSRELV